jgi:hypothetical protein
MVTVDRRADSLLDDLLASVTGARPHVVSVWGVPGSGRATTVRRACRAARLHGFVPVAARMLADLDAGLVRGRQVCLIVEPGLPWTTALLTLTAVSPRAHVIVVVGVEEAVGMRSIGLEPLSTQTLEHAVTPSRLSDTARADIRRRAVRIGDAECSGSRSNEPSTVTNRFRMTAIVRRRVDRRLAGGRTPLMWPPCVTGRTWRAVSSGMAGMPPVFVSCVRRSAAWFAATITRRPCARWSFLRPRS